MALYAISDLHLSNSVSKPMDVFGGKWQGYMEKIEKTGGIWLSRRIRLSLAATYRGASIWNRRWRIFK